MTAVLIGLAIVNIAKPGALADDDQRLRNRIDYELWVRETTWRGTPAGRGSASVARRPTAPWWSR